MMMMQPEPKNKEQFKLLQYSDDSKSLSDLELTEIVVPRKRKVRRKTKPKNGHRHRKQLSGDGSSTGPCRNIGIWVAIASNVGWLLILSYIVSMVHSEYAQMSREQAKLAASIKTMPDEWHDKAHGLEVNQSTLFHKLFDLQQSMQNLTEDFLQLRLVLQQQQAQSNDVARVGLLEKSLADFGASLKSLNSEIDSLKNRSLKFNEAIGMHTEAIDYFRTVIVQRRLNETDGSTSGGPGTTAEEEAKIKRDIEELRNVTQSLGQRVDQVNATFSSFALSERQKVDELEKNHEKKINDLNDSVANVTSQDVNQAMKNYQDKMAGLESRMASLEKTAERLEQDRKSVEQLKNQFDGFNASLQRLQTPPVVGNNAGDGPSGGGEEKRQNGVAGQGDAAASAPAPKRGREGAPMM